jgi:SpoVK/Ycf46/Vps4 family AAA+-type ATPase
MKVVASAIVDKYIVEKIEIPLPNEAARLDILKIHSATITKRGDIDYKSVVKLAEGFNGADLRNSCNVLEEEETRQLIYLLVKY